MTLGPDASTDALVAFWLGSAHFEALDEDGRPLGEVAARAYAGCPHREARRTFGDGRDATGKPANLAALAQLEGAWPALLASLAGFEAERPATFGRAYRRAVAGTVLGRARALAGPVPRADAALYKVCVGFGEVIAAALIEERVDADAPPPGADTLFAWLDERPWLVGDAQVCAGTRRQIARVWAALAASEAPPSSLFDGAPTSALVDATLALCALAAVAAGAVRVHVAHGAPAAALDPGLACVALYVADDVPRVVETLRQSPGAGPLHPTLLFAADEVPACVRGLIEALPAPGAALGA
ncbi:MAG: hypothetical protein KF729_10425, partial [Sandaracinaceae bacterium]|nr:hypothetical protein [Sandaracinaceae bacterium]